VLSFNVWAGWFPIASSLLFAKATLFDLIDHLTSNVLLPGGGFGLAIFVGWVVPKRALVDELGLGRSELALLRWLLRYLVPIGITVATITPFFEAPSGSKQLLELLLLLVAQDCIQPFECRPRALESLQMQ